MDGVNLRFTDDALEAIAQYAVTANETMENIGARRLHTIVENMLEDISFNAGDIFPSVDVVVDASYVREHVKGDFKEKNLGKYIL